MIPLWLTPLLDASCIGEFSFQYDNEQSISIKGKLIDDEWVVDISVKATPYFSWGCNKFRTGINGLYKKVVKYYLMQVVNDLTAYGVDSSGIIRLLKDDLD